MNAFDLSSCPSAKLAARLPGSNSASNSFARLWRSGVSIALVENGQAKLATAGACARSARPDRVGPAPFSAPVDRTALPSPRRHPGLRGQAKWDDKVSDHMPVSAFTPWVTRSDGPRLARPPQRLGLGAAICCSSPTAIVAQGNRAAASLHQPDQFRSAYAYDNIPTWSPASCRGRQGEPGTVHGNISRFALLKIQPLPAAFEATSDRLTPRGFDGPVQGLGLHTLMPRAALAAMPRRRRTGDNANVDPCCYPMAGCKFRRQGAPVPAERLRNVYP